MRCKFFCFLLLSMIIFACDDFDVIRSEVEKEIQMETGEGIMWHSGRQTLFWVDVEKHKLYEHSPERCNTREWSFDKMLSGVAPESDSTIILALQDKVIRFNLNTEKQDVIANIPLKDVYMRCNEGKCGPSGCFWIGTMSMKGTEKEASLFCINHKGEVYEMQKNITLSNGMVWSVQNRFMYYIDTPTRKVVRYRYDKSDVEILHDGVAFYIPEGCGFPYGMTIDENGNLWIAHWGGSAVYCYNPYTGEMLTKVEVPALNVTSCTFGGPDLDLLYITTARSGMTDEQLKQYPLSGSVFVCKPGVRGLDAYKFK